MRRLCAALPPCSRSPACGEKAEPSAGGPQTRDAFTVILDYFPNADHAGIYAAQAQGLYAKAGLDVKIVQPPDAAAPLKLLRAGRATSPSPTSPSCCWRATRARRTSSPSPRSCRSR